MTNKSNFQLRNKNKAAVVCLFLAVCLLTACSPLAYNHVVINESDDVLDIEYEYFVPMVKHDNSQLTTPAKMNLTQYADEDAEKIWSDFSGQNEYETESRKEEVVSAENMNNEKITATEEVRSVRLKLFPGEVLRVFASTRVNHKLTDVKRISLIGKKGKLQIEGAGFEQFAEHRTGGFFSGAADYRIVYK